MLAALDADQSTDTLAALTRAVGERADAGEITAAVRRAIAGGSLAPDASGHAFVPRVPAAPVAAPPSWRPWLDRGYVPFRTKAAPPDPAAAKVLPAVFDLLNDIPELRCVPHWVAGDVVLSLYLPAAADLRPVAGGDPTVDADMVRRACLRSLARFVEWDQAIREAAVLAGGAEPAAFPVAARYAWARTKLTDLLGDVNLPPELPGPLTGPDVQFCDPKPANFLMPAADRHRLGEPGVPEPVRVDLDMMAGRGPLSLQIVLVVFSYPFAVGSGSHGAAFERLRRSAHHAAESFHVDPAEVDVMLHYHLLRNVVSALTGGPAYAGKARGMAAMLVAAWERLPGLAVRRGAGDLLHARADQLRGGTS